MRLESRWACRCYIGAIAPLFPPGSLSALPAPFDFADLRTWIAFGRGLFFEILTYAWAKLTKLLWHKGARKGALVVGVVALWCIVVSAGNNLGWVLSGKDFVCPRPLPRVSRNPKRGRCCALGSLRVEA